MGSLHCEFWVDLKHYHFFNKICDTCNTDMVSLQCDVYNVLQVYFSLIMACRTGCIGMVFPLCECSCGIWEFIPHWKPYHSICIDMFFSPIFVFLSTERWEFCVKSHVTLTALVRFLVNTAQITIHWESSYAYALTNFAPNAGSW